MFACLHYEYSLKSGSPYIDKLQRITNRLLEAGMTTKRLKRNNVSMAPLSLARKTMNLSLVIFGFVVGVGYGVSIIIAFSYEYDGYGRWKC